MTFEEMKGIMRELSDLMDRVAELDSDANEVDDAYSEMDSAFENLERLVLREFPDDVEVLVYDYDGNDKDPTYRTEMWRGTLGELIEGQEASLGSSLDGNGVVIDLESDAPDLFNALEARRLLSLRDPEVTHVEFTHMTVVKNFSP